VWTPCGPAFPIVCVTNSRGSAAVAAAAICEDYLSSTEYVSSSRLMRTLSSRVLVDWTVWTAEVYGAGQRVQRVGPRATLVDTALSLMSFLRYRCI
jgi:hypothetical protein